MRRKLEKPSQVANTIGSRFKEIVNPKRGHGRGEWTKRGDFLLLCHPNELDESKGGSFEGVGRIGGSPLAGDRRLRDDRPAPRRTVLT
jgi:hypothetical protein